MADGVPQQLRREVTRVLSKGAPLVGFHLVAVYADADPDNRHQVTYHVSDSEPPGDGPSECELAGLLLGCAVHYSPFGIHQEGEE